MTLTKELIFILENWKPKQKYRSEKKYIEDLRETLNKEFNSYKGGFPSKKKKIKVFDSPESCDIIVENKIGIEIKRTTKREIPKKKVDRLFEEIINHRKDAKSGIFVILVGNENPDTYKYLKSRIDKLRYIKENRNILTRLTKKASPIFLLNKGFN